MKTHAKVFQSVSLSNPVYILEKLCLHFLEGLWVHFSQLFVDCGVYVSSVLSEDGKDEEAIVQLVVILTISRLSVYRSL